MQARKFSTWRIYSQIQDYVREDPLGRLENLNLAHKSESWDNWVLIPVVISLKYLWLFVLLCPNLVTLSLTLPLPTSTPTLCSVLLSLHQARAQDLLQGMGTEGSCCQESLQGSGVPGWGWEFSLLPTQSTGAGGSWWHSEILEVWSSILNTAMVLYFLWFCISVIAKGRLTQAAQGCPKHGTPQPLLCWVMAAWSRSLIPLLP